MKKLSIVFLLTLSVQVIGQETYFNRLYDLDLRTQRAFICDVHAGIIYISGQGKLDAQTGQGLFYVELESDGNLLINYYFQIDSATINNNLRTDNFFLDGSFTSIYGYNRNSYIYKIDQYSHTLIDSTINDFQDYTRSLALNIFEDKDGIYWISGKDDEYIDDEYFNHAFIFEFGKQEEKVYFLSYQENISNHQVFPYSDSSFVIFKYDLNWNEDFDDNWTMFNTIEERHRDGSLIQSWTSKRSDRLGFLNNVYFKESTKEFYIAGHEVRSDTIWYNGFIDRPKLYKFSFENGIEWSTLPMGTYWDGLGALRSNFRQIIPANEGDGIVCVGTKQTVEQDTFYKNGIISKYDFDGNLMWSNEYSVYNGTHILNDIASFDGNGYVAVGTMDFIYDLPDSIPQWPTWVLKIDNEGGFIGGNSIEGVEEEMRIKLSPNPVKDQLRVELDEQVIGSANIEITNIEGQLVKRMPTQNLEESIDVSAFHAGVYILSIIQNGKKRYSEKFIKQ